VVTVRLRMIEPWVNPRSRFFWFRRRIPAQYRKYGMPSEIKFSLETTDRDEAVLRCQEKNLKLERQWRASLALQLPFRFEVGSLSDHLMSSAPE
jgi:hypothetical protein